MMNIMKPHYLSFQDFVNFGKESQFRYTNKFIKWFIGVFGPLGINIKIRSSHILRHFAQYMVLKEAKIMDVGCGQAYIDFFLGKNKPEWEILAVDVDEKLIKENDAIRKRLKINNLKFLTMGANNIDFENLFDFVISMDVLEHIADDSDAINRFYASLKPTGKLFLHLPFPYEQCKRIMPGFGGYFTHDHVRDEYTEFEITQKLTNAGFKNINILYSYGVWGELAFELNYLFWKVPLIRKFSAFITHPFALRFAYKDTQVDNLVGNAMVVIGTK